MHQQDNNIYVTVLGSGTCVPSLERSSCSVLIQTPETKLLFDSGPGTMRRLLKAGVTIFDISYIFYSHLHPDHTGEFVPFLFATKYPNQSKRCLPLSIIAGKGFKHFYHQLRKVYGQWIELPENILTITELNNKKADFLQFDNFTVHSIPVEHAPESIAFRVTFKDKISIVYSGDTDYTKNLVTLAKDADLFICESAFPDALKVKGHLTPSLAGEIASQANVRKLVLTHFHPECDEVDIVKECGKTYNGSLILAHDLLEIKTAF